MTDQITEDVNRFMELCFKLAREGLRDNREIDEHKQLKQSILQALEEYPKLKEQNARNREDKEYWEKATKHEYQQFLKLKAEIEELKLILDALQEDINK